MYLSFYNLREFPFAITCDERFFFESDIHAEALANMMYTVQERKGMVLITGEVGAGKTFVGNMLASRLGVNAQTVRLANPPASPKQLVRALATHAGLNVRVSADKQDLIEQLEQHLIRQQQRGRLMALILDEAQDLSAASIEELRLLWNWEHEGKRLLQIVMIGQPELRRRLMEPTWEPIRQRIVLSYHLRALNSPDTEAYIRHRLKVASDRDLGTLFTPEALSEIYAATNGIPRLVNILCDNALLVGYVQGAASIDRPVIGKVLREMSCWGLRSAPQAPAEASQEKAWATYGTR